MRYPPIAHELLTKPRETVPMTKKKPTERGLAPTSSALARGGELVVPAVIADAGAGAAEKFIEFFTAHIPNDNTRRAYGRAVGRFLLWCEERDLALNEIRAAYIAAYIRQLGRELATSSVKQHLAAIRMMLDYLVVGQVLDVNPASAVRGPKLVTRPS